MNQKTAEFFNDIILMSRENAIEVRCLAINRDKKNLIKFSKSIAQLDYLIKKFSQDYNMYFGINPRVFKGYSRGIPKYKAKARSVFFFDIEGASKKHGYENIEYRTKLLETAKYLREELREHNINDFSALVWSGRGLHAYVKIQPYSDYLIDRRFKIWWKRFIKKAMKKRPHEDIKFDDSMFDLSRIAGLPSTCHLKYEDKPQRFVLALRKDAIYNIVPMLEEICTVSSNVITYCKPFADIKDRYDRETIWHSPLHSFIKNYGLLLAEDGTMERHTGIIFPSKLLMRDNNLNDDEIKEKWVDFISDNMNKYEAADWDSPVFDSYKFSREMILRWQFKYYRWFVDNKIRSIYDPEKIDPWGRTSTNNVFYINRREIVTMKDLKDAIVEFNSRCIYNDILYFNEPQLKEMLESSMDAKLWRFISKNSNIYEHLKYMTYHDRTKKEFQA